MKQIITEIVIPLLGGTDIFSPQRITIRLDDEGGGPFLVIRGIDDDDKENEHSFYLQSIAEIDEFAAICKGMLPQDEAKKKKCNLV